ncbi:cobalamin-binding protein [Massilia sp. PAMC28688]|uniref:cobalamin-binding protein n=1 Tax=Massilia sp. PAMC28688 TaxID=2861283 RepID=UPI001C630DDE|nr:cobalamin-binding protein [Massilia sp. PAMC28688]QYF94041.1 cobalamin-binding protein [Massilia sp. PAMC28688]
MSRHLWPLLVAAVLAPVPAHAAVTVVDDTGKRVTLARPAQRVISMAPHVTEMLFAAGGGARVVGVMNYSDYPEQARSLPLVGSSSQLDMERVLALKPDLLVVWQGGNTERQLAQLKSLGIPMFFSDPRKMAQIGETVARLGQLMGTERQAQAASAAFRAELAALSARYAKRPPVRMFYQIWDKPLYTLNGTQIVSDAMRLCGGVNVFGHLQVTAPAVSIEAVIEQDPEVIFAGDRGEESDAGLNIWRPYQGMLAVKRQNLFTLKGGLLARAGPRMVQGVAALCEKLELARQRRP